MKEVVESSSVEEEARSKPGPWEAEVEAGRALVPHFSTVEREAQCRDSGEEEERSAVQQRVEGRHVGVMVRHLRSVSLVAEAAVGVRELEVPAQIEPARYAQTCQRPRWAGEQRILVGREEGGCLLAVVLARVRLAHPVYWLTFSEPAEEVALLLFSGPGALVVPRGPPGALPEEVAEEAPSVLPLIH